MYDIRSYYQAASIYDACQASLHQPEAIIIAGGSDVLIKIREGKLAGSSLISIRGITELQGIELTEQGDLVIKPLTTFSEITENPLIQQRIPMLGQAVDLVGGPQIRHIGTIGGNICNGVTSADSATSLFVLDAVLEISHTVAEAENRAGSVGQVARRLIRIQDFYRGPGKVDLEPGEILTGIYITKENYQNYYGHYIKYAMREAMDIATLGCAVSCKLDKTGRRLADLRIAFGVAGPVPMRCPQTEAALQGQEISLDLFDHLAKLVINEVRPRDSWRASKAFRMQLVHELSQRALQKAIEYAKQGGQKDD